jgi:hypothetical protein
LDRVQTEPGRNSLWQDFNQFRFGSDQIPNLDRKFPVQIGFWTEFIPNLVEILSGRILTSLGLALVKFPVQTRFWTEFKPNLVEILFGRILTSLGLALVEFLV